VIDVREEQWNSFDSHHWRARGLKGYKAD
jgi:hypothetical protein